MTNAEIGYPFDRLAEPMPIDASAAWLAEARGECDSAIELLEGRFNPARRSTAAEQAAFQTAYGELPDPDAETVRLQWPRLTTLARARMAAIDAALTALGYDPQGCYYGKLTSRPG